MRSITSEEHIQQVRERGGADFAFAFGEAARFRVSVFKEKGNFGMVLRQIPSKMLTFEQIGLPESVKELLFKPRGLILVTGPTGSGKSTTLASLLNIVNETRDEVHLITIEDPIEYYHKHKKALITQREVHVDVPNFAEALRRALAPGPGHDSGRRNARLGNDRGGHHGGGNGPLGVSARCTRPARPRRLTV
jgi:twitching motility protein PilT